MDMNELFYHHQMALIALSQPRGRGARAPRWEGVCAVFQVLLPHAAAAAICNVKNRDITGWSNRDGRWQQPLDYG